MMRWSSAMRSSAAAASADTFVAWAAASAAIRTFSASA